MWYISGSSLVRLIVDTLIEDSVYWHWGLQGVKILQSDNLPVFCLKKEKKKKWFSQASVPFSISASVLISCLLTVWEWRETMDKSDGTVIHWLREQSFFVWNTETNTSWDASTRKISNFIMFQFTLPASFWCRFSHYSVLRFIFFKKVTFLVKLWYSRAGALCFLICHCLTIQSAQSWRV